MRTINIYDKLLLLLGFLIVIAIFILAFILYFKGGQCAINPCEYATQHNISCFNPLKLTG